MTGFRTAPRRGVWGLKWLACASGNHGERTVARQLPEPSRGLLQAVEQKDTGLPATLLQPLIRTLIELSGGLSSHLAHPRQGPTLLSRPNPASAHLICAAIILTCGPNLPRHAPILPCAATLTYAATLTCAAILTCAATLTCAAILTCRHPNVPLPRPPGTSASVNRGSLVGTFLGLLRHCRCRTHPLADTPAPCLVPDESPPPR